MAKAISKPLALALAVGLTLGGSFGAGAPAFAQNVQDAPQLAERTPAAATIPAEDNFTLTLHKRLNPQNLRNSTGLEDPEVGGTKLDGAEFRIEKLAGDIRSQAGLEHLVTVADDFNKARGGAPKPPTEGHTETKTTVDGKATFGNLPAGAYLVTETRTPNIEGAEAYIPSKPFIVLVPMTNPEGTAWNSDVHMYPKNSQVRVDKQVSDAKKHAEDETRDPESSTVTYTLDGLVPAAPQGRELKNFKLTDASRDDELRFDRTGNAFITKVQRIPAGEDESAAVDLPESNYEVNFSVSRPTNTTGMAEGANQFFEVVVPNPAGAGLQPGDSLRVVVNATLLKAPDQQIENSVNESGIFRDPDTGSDDEGFETPHDKVVSYIGNIQVVKVDESNEETRLEGAAFELYNCADETEVIQTGTTNENGEILFEGIHVSDHVDGDFAPHIEYCLREFEAPAGYTMLDDQPRRIQLTVDDGRDPQGAPKIRMVSEQFKNRPSSEVPILPSTGGMGILIVALLGLGIIAGGVYAARRNSAKA
ncbi:SpaH/EbpB family LPXTG-anchored major pilin [Corynebacterium propinquum]|uniref:SpaH/EbpB family LPXTG-anchored major pilin n=1 Tax=Corynebacterium propinquum TaxID=43769 RepID=UPI00254268ED|nr:SpaH/EbpB family LPXTG-anchored major pilin [Corynebacterium propinquum]MDK4235261.1 SpaH/EbpB family LPXTG-anchored major pilin [Corynebacterium propinquum]